MCLPYSATGSVETRPACFLYTPSYSLCLTEWSPSFCWINERPPYALTLSVAFPGSCPDFMKTQLASPLLKLVLGRIQSGWAESTSHPAIWSGPIRVHEGCHVATQCTNKQKPNAFQSWAINNLAKLIQNTSLNSETELRRKWCVCLSSRAELNTADGKRVQVLT